jgi:CRISPR-associated protein Cas2
MPILHLTEQGSVVHKTGERLRVAKALRDFGDRVQRSVFECLLDGAQADRMESRIRRLIEPEEDSVRIYRLCASCREAIRHHGQGGPTELPEVFIV